MWDEVNKRWIKHMNGEDNRTGMRAGVYRVPICGEDDRNVTTVKSFVTCEKCLKLLEDKTK